MIVTVIVFLVVLTILVLIHEAGHFFVAKKFGIKVEEFGFGFPPRAFGIKRGETIYSINWLPIGGFVKLYGEDEAGSGKLSLSATNNKQQTTNNREDESRAFYARPTWQRALVVVAGVVMNFILAVTIISYIFTQGIHVPTERVHIEEVLQNTPAAQVGLIKNDVIVDIDGKKVTKMEEVSNVSRDKAGVPVVLAIERLNKDGQKQIEHITIIPRKDFPTTQGPMGIEISNVELKKYSILQAPFYGTIEALRISWITVSSLGIMLWQFLFGGQVPTGVAGPVGVAKLTGEAVQVGPIAVIAFAGFLSLNLAIINILPIPALDGGRFFFILIEMVTRRKVNPHFEQYAHTIGMILLLTLMALITFRDITRLISGQPILPTQ